MDEELAPTGTFRVGTNGNNATLVTRHADGSVTGLSADLGRFVAARLGVPYAPVVYASAAPYTASFGGAEWDMILTGKNDVVAQKVAFCGDLFLIDYVYVAAPGCTFASPEEVDAEGIRIAVPRNASADVYLSRNARHARLVRVDGDASAGIELLRDGKVDAYATGMGNAQVMVARMPGAKIVGAFNTVVFSVAARRALSAAACERLAAIIADAKAAGVVRKGLEQAGATGVRLAS